MLSHLVAAFIAARISGVSQFRHVCHSKLFFFFFCFPWYRRAELVLELWSLLSRTLWLFAGMDAFVQCFSPSPKKTHLRACSSSHSFPV
ncbi:hypothetical protein DY000_02036357 [Brassica cretica]|uniref:Secreted protein n=1 Tax=Brassica cretica TaxID=69181 RepID=A0ABQ7BPF4_BRACR|nr:hypothetical protein DY000_02036357 [Brassica cretica]